MGVLLILIIGVLVALLLLLNLVARVVQAIGLIALLGIGGVLAVVGYVSIFIAGISLALLYQLLGSANGGLALAISGVIGIASATAMLRAILTELKGFSSRVRTFFGGAKHRGSNE